MEDCLEEAHVSVHAMSCMIAPSYRTMRVTGRVGKKEFCVLLDGGSSHNFIHPDMLTKFGIKTEEMEPMSITVANGGKLQSSFQCPEFKWTMHGHEFCESAMILPIKGCDMVLGVQWLSILGDILWNFNTLRMEFMYNGKRVVLRGLHSNNLKVIKSSRMRKLLQQSQQVESAMLCLI